MRKTMISPSPENIPSSGLNFLDLDQLALVEFTSECPEHPVESALRLTEESGAGWRAASSGEQTLRVVFDQPCAIERIFLEFDEQQQPRTQEFVLLGLMDNESAYREILRQQYHFSPPNTTQEIEHYEVKLNRLKALELRIIPDIGGGDACATLKKLRLG